MGEKTLFDVDGKIGKLVDFKMTEAFSIFKVDSGDRTLC
jgi:hypothetical protein